MATQCSSIGQHKDTNTTTFGMNNSNTTVNISADKSYSGEKNKADKLNWKHQKEGK